MNNSAAGNEMAILFADIGGSTGLYQTVGDEAAHSLIANSLQLMSQAVRENSGTLLRTTGDAVLAKFSSCDEACAAATRMQVVHQGTALEIRVGFHWGSAIDDLGDVYGNAVNIAARVVGVANTGEILATREVTERLSGKRTVHPQLLNKLALKGLEAPVDIYRIPWVMEAMDTPTSAPTMSMQDDFPGVPTELLLTSGTKTVVVNSSSDSCTIGRGKNNTICTTHVGASRLHAKIDFKGGRCVLEDFSTNGTYVSKNGQPAILIHRDTVTLEGSGILNIGFFSEQADDEKSIRFVNRVAGSS